MGILKDAAAQKIMKKTYIISGIVALTIIATTAGVISTVRAAGGSPAGMFGRFWGKPHQALTAAQQADMKTKMDAVNAALSAGDYNAWVAAKKTINANSPLLTKITADNFSQYVQAYNLQKQADDIMTKLGIGKGGDMGGLGYGMRGGFGLGRPHR